MIRGICSSRETISPPGTSFGAGLHICISVIGGECVPGHQKDDQSNQDRDLYATNMVE
jgi:hypothetical protein